MTDSLRIHFLLCCQGIGPCYASKIQRNGLRIGDLKHFDDFVAKLSDLAEYTSVSTKSTRAPNPPEHQIQPFPGSSAAPPGL